MKEKWDEREDAHWSEPEKYVYSEKMQLGSVGGHKNYVSRGACTQRQCSASSADLAILVKGGIHHGGTMYGFACLQAVELHSVYIDLFLIRMMASSAVCSICCCTESRWASTSTAVGGAERASASVFSGRSHQVAASADAASRQISYDLPKNT